MRLRKSPRSDGSRTPGSFPNPESEAAIFLMFRFGVSYQRRCSNVALNLIDGVMMACACVSLTSMASLSLAAISHTVCTMNNVVVVVVVGGRFETSQGRLTVCTNLFNWEPASEDRSCCRRQN